MQISLHHRIHRKGVLFQNNNDFYNGNNYENYKNSNANNDGSNYDFYGKKWLNLDSKIRNVDMKYLIDRYIIELREVMRVN